MKISKISTRVGVVAALLLMSTAGAHAQRGAMHFAPSRPASPRPAPPRRMTPTHASSGVVQTGGTTATTFTNGTSTFTFLDGSSLPLDQLLNPVPGLGFDFTHLAAINRDLDIRALIDPITQARLALAERLAREFPRPVFFPGFFDGSAPFIEQAPQQQQPPIIVLQQPAAPSETERVVQQPVAQAAPEAPLADAGEFTLVKRDGTQIPAVAFVRQGDQIVYVTREGKRRSLALGDLDSDATRNLNEERGTSLQLAL